MVSAFSRPLATPTGGDILFDILAPLCYVPLGV